MTHLVVEHSTRFEDVPKKKIKIKLKTKTCVEAMHGIISSKHY